MDSETGSYRDGWLTSGKGTWSARCREIGTSGAAGGPGKRVSRKADAAPRSDPTILAFIDVDETYRRDIKDIRNLQENRHSLARKICHGKKGELYHRYERGLENQLGALGLVLNCATLWTTVYLDAAVRRLKAQGYPVRTEDMARLSPFVHSHLGVHGTYTFALPDLAPGAIRDLRDPDAAGDDDDICPRLKPRRSAKVRRTDGGP
ncbi:Tn3 family transposase [Streptosporangium canum]|uniref:Tn3 family transposase n=1 Tax=Streptosporangium canum TaxID=324952 RepID=UPI0036A5725F